MVKKILLIMCFTVLVLSLKAQYIKLDFNTNEINGGEYTPRHIFAVWVESENDVFINTLVVYANERKSKLAKWNAASGGYKADAVSGATLNDVQKNHSIEWDLKDFARHTVANGTYKLCMEITSDDFAGPYREVEFEIDGNDFTLEPADGGNFSNIKMIYEDEVTTVDLIDYNDKYLKLYPSPVTGNLNISVLAEKNTNVLLKIHDSQGKIIKTVNESIKEGINSINGNKLISNISPGIYYLQAETDHYKVAKKLIIK